MNKVEFDLEEYEWKIGDCCLIHDVPHMIVAHGSSPLVRVLNLTTGIVDAGWESLTAEDLTEQISHESEVVWVPQLTISHERLT